MVLKTTGGNTSGVQISLSALKILFVLMIDFIVDHNVMCLICRKFSATRSYFLQRSTLIKSFDHIFTRFIHFFHFIFCNHDLIHEHV